jgi:hypothetical protein
MRTLLAYITVLALLLPAGCEKEREGERDRPAPRTPPAQPAPPKAEAPPDAQKYSKSNPPPPEVGVQMIRSLGRRVSFEFIDTPLQEALCFLNSLAKVNLILDPRVTVRGIHNINFKFQI